MKDSGARSFRWSIKLKILAGTTVPLVLGMVILLIITTIAVNRQTDRRLATIRQQQEAAVEEKLKALVQQAIASVKNCMQEGDTGVDCLSRVKDMTFGSTYVWVHSFDGNDPNQVKMVMHPTVSSLNGEDVSDYRDLERLEKIAYRGEIYDKNDPAVDHIEEVNLFVDMNKVCKESDSGVVRYYWPKPKKGGGVTEAGYEKMSYVQYMPEQHWVFGTGEYIDNIDEKVAAEAAIAKRQARQLLGALIIGFAILTIVLVILIVILAQAITVPLKKATNMLRDISQGEGDLTVKLMVKTRDELGDMAGYFNEFVAKLRGIISNLTENSTAVSASSEELSATSTEMAASAEEMSSQISTIAAAGEEMSSNINSVASGAEEMSSSVNTVATAIEEMSSSLSEVAQNCEKESQIAGQANSQAQETRDLMNRLGEAASAIGKVVEMISSIADQTNLLALNATIEAASAGEAGKGFAVVANEVKELAKQSAEATEQISRQIEDIQASTGQAVSAMGEISGVIEEVSSISQTIAAAVEEQSSTTNEIAQNVSGANEAATAIAKHVQEAASGANEIAKTIQGANQAAQQSASGATETNASASELAKLAGGLQQIVSQFKI
jgi:methyl-accepting chemotaxis protein